ncbi:MAG TPA: IS1595 family transposase [Paenibacillaceae bacterium]
MPVIEAYDLTPIQDAQRFRKMRRRKHSAAIRRAVRAFRRRFPSEEACRKFLFRMKWPGGFRCPRCACPAAYTVRTRAMPLYECRRCRHQTTLSAGTVMAGSRTPPGKWLLAMWLVSRVPDGISARQLQPLLGVTYKTAFSMLRKIRSVITQADNGRPLTGRVQAIGVKFWRLPIRANRSDWDMPAVAAWELSKDGRPLRVKMKAADGCHLLEKGNYLRGLEEWKKRHAKTMDLEMLHVLDRWKVAALADWYEDACKWANRVHCGVSRRYWHNYLDEYVFRLNGKLAVDRKPASGKAHGVPFVASLLAGWCMGMRAKRTEALFVPPRIVPCLTRRAAS